MWMSLRSVLFAGAFFLPISEARGLQTHLYDEITERVAILLDTLTADEIANQLFYL